MGTSGSSSGPGTQTPLVPSWLDDLEPGSLPSDTSKQPTGDAEGGPEPGEDLRTAPQTAERRPARRSRFSTPRSNFTSFAKTGERRALGRAAREYVRSACGGSRQAARKMGASRGVAADLASVFATSIRRGPTEALRRFSLSEWASRPLADVLGALADFFCPEGGTIDAGIARHAFVETMIATNELGDLAFENLSTTQMTGVLIDFITNSVEAKILNDIGSKAISVPSDPKAVLAREKQMNAFVKRFVSDAVASKLDLSQELSSRELDAVISETYETAFNLMSILGEDD